MVKDAVGSPLKEGQQVLYKIPKGEMIGVIASIVPMLDDGNGKLPPGCTKAEVRFVVRIIVPPGIENVEGIFALVGDGTAEAPKGDPDKKVVCIQ